MAPEGASQKFSGKSSSGSNVVGNHSLRLSITKDGDFPSSRNRRNADVIEIVDEDDDNGDDISVSATASGAATADGSDGAIYPIIKFGCQMCPCCREDRTNNQLRACRACQAVSCISCLQRWVKQQPTPQLALETMCIAKCGYILNHGEIQEVVGSEEFERISDCALRNLGPPFYYCPIPDCPYIGEWHGEDEEDEFPAEICVICEKSRCILCKAVPFHDGATCEAASATQESTSALSVSDLAILRVKQCPNPRCARMISKERGTCNKMMCVCGYKFCYKCGIKDALCSCTSDDHTFWDNVKNSILTEVGQNARN